MILLDLSQVMISNLMMQLAVSKDLDKKVDENLVRHMVLNSIRSYRSKFGNEYGEIVICCDSRRVWRRDIFPHYKAHRKKDREESAHDWTSIFDAMSKIRNELEEHMPYKIVQIDGAEADDIIGAMCHRYGETMKNGGEKILILSGDKDFSQLQKYSNVYQYSPMQKKYIIVDNPERFLREHIMSGDRGDGIPNFLSDDDTFVTSKRQKNLRRADLEVWSQQTPESFCNEKMLYGYKRNELLINLNMIPTHIQNEIMVAYDSFIPKQRSSILPYFMNNKLSTLTERLSDF